MMTLQTNVYANVNVTHTQKVGAYTTTTIGLHQGRVALHNIVESPLH